MSQPVKIASIETAILAWLKSASDTGALPYSFEARRSWPEAWDEELAKLGVATQAVWATFGGWTQPENLRSGAKVKANFAVAVAAKNKRNPAAAAQGGPVAGEVGVLTLMEDVIGLLMGSDLNLDIGGLELGPVTLVPSSDVMIRAGFSLIVIQFTTTFLLEKPALPFQPSAEFIGVFDSLMTSWTVSALDDPQAELFTDQTLNQET